MVPKEILEVSNEESQSLYLNGCAFFGVSEDLFVEKLDKDVGNFCHRLSIRYIGEIGYSLYLSQYYKDIQQKYEMPTVPETIIISS